MTYGSVVESTTEIAKKGDLKMIKGKRRTVWRFFTAVMMFTLLLLLNKRSVFADPYIVSKIDLVCISSAFNLDPASTEGQVNERRGVAQYSSTIGTKFDSHNSGLMYWNEAAKEIYGIGDGTKQVQPSRSYYLCYILDALEDSDWPDEVKTLTGAHEYPIADIPEIRVYVNELRRTDVRIGYNKSWNSVSVYVPFGNELSSVSASKARLTYNGKVQTPKNLTVLLEDGKKVPKDLYTLYYIDEKGKTVSPVSAGKYTAVIDGKGIYFGRQPYYFTIDKAPGVLKVKGKTAVVKAAALKKKNQTLAVKKVLKVSGVKGKLKYKKLSGNKKITIDKTTGKVTIKKGLKAGNYKIKVKVADLGNANYKAVYKTAVFTIKVR